MKRSSIMSFGLLAFGLFLAAPYARAQQKSLKETIVGTWVVTSVSDHYEDGKKVNPWGDGVKGRFVFDANGQFIQVLIGEKQAAMKSDDPRRADALTLTYIGTYTVSEADKTISTRTERATNSARDGSEPKWTVTGSGDTLTLIGTTPPKDTHGTFSPHVDVKRAK